MSQGYNTELVDEYTQAKKDCEKGIYHNARQSEMYDRGYSEQYHLEQNMEVATRGH